MARLNDYDSYQSAQKLLIFTATYGDGDPPSSAVRFLEKFERTKPANKMEYAVVGFGSMLYPNFCSYAVEVSKKLKAHPDFKPIMGLTRINEQSFAQFRGWANNWGAKEDIPIHLELKASVAAEPKIVEFTVSEISALNVDDTFLLKLTPAKRVKFRSGDLIGIIPPGADRERLYSVARVKGNILLSIKKHDQGKCSGYLSNLKPGDNFKGRIEKNKKFHFPTKAPSVIMISNGTGIAPYLGMISKKRKARIQIFWGGERQIHLPFTGPTWNKV